MARNLRKAIPLGTVVAQRELTFARGQVSHTLRVQVGTPVPDPAHAEGFLCPILVDGLDREERLVVGGVDTMQALTLALRALPAFLAACARQYGGQLSWLGNAALGF
jgi:hypothetical protein